MERMPKMKCIGIGNKKGGVGKTTISINLSCEFAGRGYTVTLYDLDEQQTASHWYANGALPVTLKTMPVENARDAEQMILSVRQSSSDLVVMDLPPHTREATEAALSLCDLFLVPISPSGADIVSASRALDLFYEVRKLRNGRPSCLLVPSRVDRRTSFGREIAEALQSFHEPVGPAIGQRSAHVDCFGLGDWIGHAYPHSTGYQEIYNLTTVVEEIIYGSKQS
jgi:chromosome partitioning protein